MLVRICRQSEGLGLTADPNLIEAHNQSQTPLPGGEEGKKTGVCICPPCMFSPSSTDLNRSPLPSPPLPSPLA